MTDEEKNIFGKQLKERRNELNLTTQKVALDAEVGESTYKRLEAGDGNPRLDTLVRIVKCLKTDLNSVVPQEHLGWNGYTRHWSSIHILRLGLLYLNLLR